MIFEAIRERQYVAVQTIVGVIAIVYVTLNVDRRHPLLRPRPQDPACPSRTHLTPPSTSGSSSVRPRTTCCPSTRASRSRSLAVEAGDEGIVKKELGFGAWLAIVWLVLLIGAAVFAPILPIDGPKEQISGLHLQQPFCTAADACPATRSAATSSAAT